MPRQRRDRRRIDVEERSAGPPSREVDGRKAPRSSQSVTLRDAWRSGMRRVARAGNREIAENRMKPPVGAGDGEASSPAAAVRRAARSAGKNGVSAAAVTIPSSGSACPRAHVNPARMPASGPANPPTRSGTTGRSNAAKRTGSPLALSASARTCGRRRSMTRASTGRPPRGRRGLSPPPRRVDRPPARMTPRTEPDAIIATP